MSITRRMFGGMAAGAALVGNRALHSVGVGEAGRGRILGESLAGGLKSTVGYDGPETAEAPANSLQQAHNPRGPAIPLQKAVDFLLQDKEFMSELTSRLYIENRYVGEVDADIAVLRAVSPMAKIVYQRQRNVTRAIDRDALEDIQSYHSLRNPRTFAQRKLEGLLYPWRKIQKDIFG